MNRREFIALGGTALVSAAIRSGRLFAQQSRPAATVDAEWHRQMRTNIVDRLTVGGRALHYPEEKVGVLDGFCRLIEDGKPGEEVQVGIFRQAGDCGLVHFGLRHELVPAADGASKPNLLAATLSLNNTGNLPVEVSCGFLTSARPCENPADQQMYLPISARGLDKEPQERDCHQRVGSAGYLCHYFEPPASDIRDSKSRAALLAPVVDLFADNGPCRVAVFTASDQPVYFEALQGPASRAWRLACRVHLEPREHRLIKAWLFLHAGDASEAWSAFRQYGHQEDWPVPEWTRKFRVHYYDYLSADVPDGHRGDGYEADLKLFPEFHVGMATQHAYYFALGDYLHPDRKEWLAMPTDPKGPAKMSIEKMRARIAATRKIDERTPVHPMVYLHFTLFDDGTPLYEKMKDFIQVDAKGQPMPFGWEGPDVIKKTWKMSTAAPEWRDHLVQQARWIMELLDPDGIVLDETFTAIGMDHHPNRRGPLSPGGIELMRKLRATVRSFGPDKALFASDCSMGPFCLWGDGEAGDHCYDRLLAHPLYRQEPVRYLAPLGDKPWQPCAWMFKTFWKEQIDLARRVGAGVSVTNGCGDGTGLANIPEETRRPMIRDIESLLGRTA